MEGIKEAHGKVRTIERGFLLDVFVKEFKAIRKFIAFIGFSWGTLAVEILVKQVINHVVLQSLLSF